MHRRPDVLTAAADYDATDPPGFRAGEVRVDAEQLGRAAGGSELNVRAFELPAGESVCPYHYEYAEEWLLVLAGEVQVRTPAGTETLSTGALACFASGPDGAHRVTAQVAARVLMFSSAREPVVAVYPDSEKVGVWVPGGRDNMLVRPADATVDYYDGEP